MWQVLCGPDHVPVPVLSQEEGTAAIPRLRELTRTLADDIMLHNVAGAAVETSRGHGRSWEGRNGIGGVGEGGGALRGEQELGGKGRGGKAVRAEGISTSGGTK